MEKKKLTDEEIIKALEFKREGRNEVVYIDGIERKIIKVTDILDFINRLQSENATLESELKKELDEHEEFTKKAKAEIERLKEKFSISHYKDSWKNKFFKAQEELERLTEEKDKYQEKWQTSYMNELNLQKQVEKLTAFKNEAISTSLYGVGRKDGKEVAVKETAKEIYSEIDDSDILVLETQEYGEIEVVSMERLKEIIKSKGVEVE